MKRYIQIILIILFYFHLSSILIFCSDIKNNETLNKSENIEINNDTLLNNSTGNSAQENDTDIFDGGDAGFFINDSTFDEKLENITKERNLKPKKKITKQQLRLIFELIYKEEKKESEIKLDENENDISPEEHSKQFMDSIFNEVTKSLDYDDKIRVKEIKEWINPTRVQRAYAELLQGLAENIDYL